MSESSPPPSYIESTAPHQGLGKQAPTAGLAATPGDHGSHLQEQYGGPQEGYSDSGYTPPLKAGNYQQQPEHAPQSQKVVYVSQDSRDAKCSIFKCCLSWICTCMVCCCLCNGDS